jgi:class 3 adenylate cyclase
MRSEYTVFGDAINLSARLMMKCRGGESPCCPFLSVLVAAVVLQLAVLQLVVLQLAV